jgi:predicted metal-binding membrane protein
MRAASRPGLFLPLIAAIAAAAWGCLLLWHGGPYARYLHAVDWADVSPLAELCRVVPGGTVILPGALFAGAWLLMIAAMMLPTTLPLLDAFRRLTAHYPDRTALIARVVAGYVAVWFLFGVAVDAVDTGIHAVAATSGWLTLHGWAVGAGVLALAGLYQFSRLKYACLDRCRSPLSFIMESWKGVDARRESLRLGVRHGLFCIGCCWSLMVVMFVVGAGSIGWMLALAALMAAEKNLPWGRALARPVGAGLLACAAAIVVAHTGWAGAWA